MTNRTPETTPSFPSLVMFNVAERRCAVPLASIERILPAAKVRRLPRTSRKILGLLELAGRLVPVVSLRRHLGLAERKIEPTDRFLLVRAGRRTLALVAEEVESDLQGPVAQGPPCTAATAQGLVRIAGGVHLIAEVDRLLDADDEWKLEQALRQRQSRCGPPRRPRYTRAVRADLTVN